MHIIQSLKRNVFSDFSVILTGNFSIVLINSISGILVARLLGPAGRGEFAAAIVWAALVGTIVQVALPQALTYYTSHTSEAVGDIFVTTAAIWLIQSIIALIIGQIIVGAVLSQSQAEALETTRVYIFSVPFAMSVTYLNTIAQGLKRFRLFSTLRMAGTIPYLFAAVIGLIFHISSPYDLIVIMLLVQVLITFIAWIAFWRMIRPKGRAKSHIARDLLRYGIKSYWGNLSWMANSRFDQIIMSAVVTLDELGQYSVAVAYAGILFPVSGAIAMLLFPSVSSLNDSEGRQAIWRSLKLNLVVTLMGTISLAALSSFAIPFLFGEDFYTAVPVAIILLIGTVFLGSNYVLSDGLRGLGLPLHPSLAEILGTVITVVGLLVVIPQYGIIGAAWVSLISYSTVTLALLSSLIFVRPKLTESTES